VTEVILEKMHGGLLRPATDADAEVIGKLKLGEGIRVKFSRVRNYRFHRKLFALMHVAFDAWEPAAGKNFERFRKDLTILAGYYEVVTRLDGSSILEPKSWSFSNMDETEFEGLYSKIADVILQKVLTNYTRDDLDRVVDTVLGFV
jgi:hypothetical protein